MMKKLYITALSMILLTMTFTTATFAWVSMAETNRVDGLGITASTDSNLEFSLDGVNYSSKITKSMLDDILKDLILEDLTSDDGLMFYSNHSKTETQAKPNRNYIYLEIFVRTNNRYTDLYLVNNLTNEVDFDNLPDSGTFVSSKGVEFRSSIDYEYAPGEMRFSMVPYTYYAKDAIRFAFNEIKLDNPNDTREEAQLNSFIFDPTENPDRGYGKPYGAIDYVNKTKVLNIKVPTSVPETLYSLSQFSRLNPYISLDTSSRVAKLQLTDQVDYNNKPLYLAKFSISIWLEGYDADMFDPIYNDALMFQLEFRTALPIE